MFGVDAGSVGWEEDIGLVIIDFVVLVGRHVSIAGALHAERKYGLLASSAVLDLSRSQPGHTAL